MFVWKEAATTHPKAGKRFIIFSDNVLVRLEDGSTCMAYYDTLNHEWCSASTTYPFQKDEVIEWRDEIEDN